MPYCRLFCRYIFGLVWLTSSAPSKLFTFKWIRMRLGAICVWRHLLRKQQHNSFFFFFKIGLLFPAKRKTREKEVVNGLGNSFSSSESANSIRSKPKILMKCIITFGSFHCCVMHSHVARSELDHFDHMEFGRFVKANRPTQEHAWK